MTDEDVVVTGKLDDTDITNKLASAKKKADDIAEDEVELRKRIGIDIPKRIETAQDRVNEVSDAEIALQKRLNEANRRADYIAEKEVRLRRDIARTASALGTIAIASISLMKNVIVATGGSLTAMADASLVVVEQIVSMAVAWFALQAAIATTPVAGQIIAGFSLAMAGIAVAIALDNAIKIATGQEDTNAKVNSALAIIGNLETIGTAGGSLF